MVRPIRCHQAHIVQCLRYVVGVDRYAFAKAHKVLLIDEFDLINEDLLMYRAFPPTIFRKRVDHLAEQSTFDTTWIIRIDRGRPIREGQLAEHDRAKGVVKLIERFARYLPDMKIVYNGHDGARIGVAAEERIRLEDLARQGKCTHSLGNYFLFQLS